MREQPAGPGKCIHCKATVKDLREISSTWLKYSGKFCDGCAKIAKNIIKKKVLEQKQAVARGLEAIIMLPVVAISKVVDEDEV